MRVGDLGGTAQVAHVHPTTTGHHVAAGLLNELKVAARTLSDDGLTHLVVPECPAMLFEFGSLYGSHSSVGDVHRFSTNVFSLLFPAFFLLFFALPFDFLDVLTRAPVVVRNHVALAYSKHIPHGCASDLGNPVGGTSR